ncbi:MAG: GPW/gp25 family protein [Armatimonadota bacterium]
MSDILGRGLKFPFQFHKRYGGAAISTATSQDQEHIHESLRQILGTRRGERFLRPDFGCRLHELLFECNDAILHGLLRHEIRDALARWEPRIIIDEVLVTADAHVVLVNVQYRLIGSQVAQNFVYPFYRGEA